MPERALQNSHARVDAAAPVGLRVKPPDCSGGAHGFTLLEMVVVVALIGIVMGVALPQLLPAIVFSRVEGAARHLAGFGRAAMAQAALMREDVTVKFDLDEQTYWAECLVREDEDEFFNDEDGEEKDTGDRRGPAGYMDLMGSSGLRQAQFGSSMGGMDEEAAAEAEAARKMRARLDRYVRAQTEARARKIDKGSLFEDMGPLFEKDFSLDDTESHIEEIKDPLLQRTKLPEDVEIEAVRVGSDEYTSGEVEVELSALGLFEPVLMHVKNQDEDYFTVVWNPLTGTVRFKGGKHDEEDMTGASQ